MSQSEERRALSLADRYWKFIVLAGGIAVALMKSSWTVQQLESELQSRDQRIGTISAERKQDHDDLIATKTDVDNLKRQMSVLEAELWKIGGEAAVREMRALSAGSR